MPMGRLGGVGILQEIVRLDESCEDFREQVGAYALINLGLVIGVAFLAFAVSFVPGLFTGARSRQVFLLTVAGWSVFNMSTPSHALLQKSMRFRAISLLSWAAAALGGGGAVVCALSGGGIWSLVAPQMCVLALSGVTAFALAPWRPDVNRLPAILGHLKSKALWYLNVGLVEEVYQRLDDIVVGRALGVRQLAFYRRAYNLGGLFHHGAGTVLTRVLFPFFAKNADHETTNARTYRAVISCVSMVLTPAVCLAAFHADGIIGSVYGEKWLACVPLFRIMSVYAILLPLFELTKELLIASGGVRESAKAYWAMLISLAVALPPGIHWLHVSGAAAAVNVALLAGLFHASHSARKLTGVSVFRCAWRAWVLCGMAALILWAVRPALPASPFWLEFVLGIVFWVALSCGMLWSFERDILRHVLTEIRAGKHG